MSTSNSIPAFSRRSFINAGIGGVAGLAFVGSSAQASSRIDGMMPGFPYLDPKLVREVVTLAHFDLDGVNKLVTACPELAKSSWDCAFGDWETPLGAASHMGRKDIVEVLTRHGARPNLFTFAMLGQLDEVRDIIEANPGIQRIHGPHGLTLLHHAKYGGEEAASVKAYLEELGDADIGYVDEALSKADNKACCGQYAIEGEAGVTFEIYNDRGMLTLKHADIPDSSLFHLGNHEFHPMGAPGFPGWPR